VEVNQEIINVVYAFASNFKLLLFHQGLKEIKNLREVVEKSLKPENVIQAEKDEKKIKVLVIAVIFSVFFSYFVDSYGFLTALTTSGWDFAVDIFLYFCILISYMLGGFINTLIQFSFFVFCLLIYAWLKQLEDEFSELNQTGDDTETTATIKKLVASQREIIKLFKQISSRYHRIIELIFVSSIFFLGVTLISTQKFDWFRLFATIPFILFDAWVLCYSSQKVIDQVKILLQFWLSMTVRFYSTVPQHVSETLRHQLG
jgi:type III secretory pathway component EscU